MKRHYTLLAATLTTCALQAQLLTLDWATEVVPANNRVKTATNGDVFALGTSANGAVIQRISASGTILWTKTLSAPTLYAIDMDVDGSDNVYISAGFTTGQLDLDPGPNTTLVDPGKVYAKYNSSGQFQWGFSIENTTDLSEDYSAISCDDAGNLYVCGDLGQGTYDFDFGPGVYELFVGDFSTGTYIARYRPDGTLAFADVRTWYGGFSNARDIAAMRDGSSFYVVQTLDNGGPLSSQIDVDPGPGVFNVYTETQNILRYDSSFQFMAQGYSGFGDVRMCTDAAGAAYIQAGGLAVKFAQNGQDLQQVYSTTLYTSGNVRLGDIAPDEQGGCLGMYSLNSLSSTIRFYKMNVSGLVDFNLYINSGSDWTYPGGKGFDLDGSALYFGTYNQNYTVDYDPGPGALNLPVNFTNDGVVARFDWCGGAPYDPFEISTPGALCVGQPASFSVSAFGDASGYTWTVPAEWTITDGQGTGTITVEADAPGSGAVSVAAVNDCGASAPIALDFTFQAPPIVDLGPDQVICPGGSAVLDAGVPGATYQWTPDNGQFTQAITISPASTTTYSVEVILNGCAGTDEVTVVVDPCLGMAEDNAPVPRVWPVPVQRGGSLHVDGLSDEAVFGIFSADGRTWHTPWRASDGARMVDVSPLPVGAYALRVVDGPVLRFVVE